MTITSPRPAAAHTPARPRLRRLYYEPEPGRSRYPGPVPAPRTRPPERPADLPRQLVETYREIAPILRLGLEVLDGRRAPAQLRPHFDDGPLRYWRAAAGQRVVQSPARCGRPRLCLPHPGTAEVAVTCHVDGRVRAVAARFERRDGRWRCTAIRLG